MSYSKTIRTVDQLVWWRKMCAPLTILLVLVSLGYVALPVHAAPIDETRAAMVKAGCVYHLTHMLTWPLDRFADQKDPLRLAFVGSDDYGLVTHFGKLLKNHQGSHRRIDVLQFEHEPHAPRATNEALGRCHMVFFLGQTGDRQEEMLTTLAATGVMTAGESDSFLESGGIVAFLIKRQRLGIWLNKDRLDRTSIIASAEFLQHAVIMEEPKD